MEKIIEGVQKYIEEIQEVKYVDEDWGQLDYYSPQFPVLWPCVLIDVSEAYFKDLGKDERATPKNRQTGDVSISLTIAMLRTTNSSGKASKYQKDTARSIHGIIKKIHGKIHGKQAHKGTGTLTRKSFRRVKRDDGVQEFTIIYSLSIKNT